jgi:predicted Zn-dependent protease
MRLRVPGLLLPLLMAVVVGNLARGETRYEAYDPGSERGLIELAADQQELINRRGLRHVDSEIQVIIDRIAAAVFPAVSDEYIDFRVYLIRDPSPISFSLAGGQIYIHTGLLARLQSEGQLAAVIAHETHHVAAHHHFSADKSRRGKATALGVTGVAANMVIGAAANAAPFLTTTLSQSFRTEFNEEMEIDADAQAVALIANAGYPRISALQVLDNILRDPELASPGISGSWTTLEEVGQRRSILQASIANNVSPATLPRPLVLRNLIEMTIDDYIRLDRAGVAVEWIDALIEDEPDSFLYSAKGDAHVALGPGPNHIMAGLTKSEIKKIKLLTRDEIDEKYLATAEGQARYRRNIDEAIGAYTEAIRLDEGDARAHAGLGNVYFNEENYRPAAGHLLTYLKLKPDAADRHFVMEKLQHIRNVLRNQKETG